MSKEQMKGKISKVLSKASQAAPAVTEAGGKLGRAETMALNALLVGNSICDSAKMAGVSPSTVYRWIKANPHFMAQYNIWHEEMEQKARSHLLSLLDKATDAVDAALEQGDSKIAMRLLEGMGVVHGAPPRLTNAGEIAEQLKLDAKRRRVERECKSISLDTDRVVADFQFNHWSDDSGRGQPREVVMEREE